MTSASAPGLVHGNREDMPYIDHHAVDHGICLCARSQLDPGPCLSFFVPPNKTDSEELCQQLSSLVKLQILWRQALPSPNTELLYGDTYLCYVPHSTIRGILSYYQHYLLRDTRAGSAKTNLEPTSQLQPIYAVTPTSTPPFSPPSPDQADYLLRNPPLFPPGFFIPSPNLTEVRFSAGAMPAASPPCCPVPSGFRGLQTK